MPSHTNGYISKEIDVIDGINANNGDVVASPNETDVNITDSTPKVLTWTIGNNETILANTLVKFKIVNLTIPAKGTHTDAILRLFDASENLLAEAFNVSFSETYEGLQIAPCKRDSILVGQTNVTLTINFTVPDGSSITLGNSGRIVTKLPSALA